MRASTKGQIQIGETIAVIVVVMILLVFALVWYSQSSRAGEAIEQDKQLRLEMLEVTKMVMNMPELHCSIATRQDTTCLDYYRLTALQRQINNGEYTDYRDMFLGERIAGYGITVEVIYPGPPPGVAQRIPVFDFRGPNVGQYDDPVAKSPIPVIVYNPVTDTNSLGMLVVAQYVPLEIPGERA